MALPHETRPMIHSDAQVLGRAIRKHWIIENEAHWTRELYFCAYMLVAFALSTVRVIFLFTRRIALNALNREQTYKRSLRQKSNRAGMDSD